MKRLILTLLVVLMCATLVHAQEYDYWVYLPVILRPNPAAPKPTPTPRPTLTPFLTPTLRPTLTSWPTVTPES